MTKMQTTAINMYNADRKPTRVEVAARVIGDLALHRVVNLDGAEQQPRRWIISHVPTGASIMSALPYVSGKPREGLSPMVAYLAWMSAVQETPEYRMWAEAMAEAPFGLGRPYKLGGRAVDASRLFAAKAHSIDAPFRT